MGKYSNFPSQTLYVRLKSTIYSTKRDDEHPRHFYMGVPSRDMLLVHQSKLYPQIHLGQLVMSTQGDSL